MLTSSGVSGPVFLSRGGRLVLWTNLATHPPMRNTRQRPYLLRRESNPSTSWSVASLNISRTVFVSASVSAVAVVWLCPLAKHLGVKAISDHATKGPRLVIQALPDFQGLLDSLWWAHISTLSSSYLEFCTPGCTQTACIPLLLLSSGA